MYFVLFFDFVLKLIVIFLKFRKVILGYYNFYFFFIIDLNNGKKEKRKGVGNREEG